jgi:hypothetical protein
MSDREQERLRKLREQQLQSRDPLTKQRKIQRNISAKEKRMRKPFSLPRHGERSPISSKFHSTVSCRGARHHLPACLWDSPYATIAGGVITLILIALWIGIRQLIGYP